MNKLDRIMIVMLALFIVSIASAVYMWSPMHHLGMGFIWLVFIVAVVLIVSEESDEKPRRRKR